MIAKKDKLCDTSMYILGEECSALLTKKLVLPQKLEDAGSFFFPYTIGSLYVDRALADLGTV